jgi:hypothetical protein
MDGGSDARAVRGLQETRLELQAGHVEARPTGGEEEAEEGKEVSETTKPVPDEKPDDECVCEHYRDEHNGTGDGACDVRASSGLLCSCPSFEKA